MSDPRGIRTVPWISLALVLSVPCLTRAGGVWQSGGPLDAKRQDVFAMAVDPTTAGTVYAGTYDSGIYKSTDGGLTWFPASLGLASRWVQALAVAPSDPRTVYAGSNGGVFWSRDGGGSWVRTGLDQSVSAVAVDPGNPARVFAGTSTGVFRSLDAGSTWTSVNGGMTNPEVQALAVDPTSPETVYAGTMGGLFKTTSSGGAWAGIDPSNVRALVLDPTAPATVYAATAAGVLRSTNGGASWSPLNNGLTNLDVYSMAIDRTAPTTLYVGTAFGGGVFKSTVAGAAWTSVGLGLGIAGFVYFLAIDTQAHDLVYAGTDTRLFRTTDGASTWSGASPGFGRVEIWALAIDPVNTGTLYAAASDTGPGYGVGVYKSTDRGGTWTAANVGLAGVELRALAVDPVTPTTVYAGGDTFFKSVNGGASWAPSGGARRDLHGLAGASTPAYFTVWNRGGGTLQASRHSSDSGSMSTAMVPSV